MMIRTSTHILKYQNKKKTDLLLRLFINYKELVQLYINMILKKELQLDKFCSTKKLPIIHGMKYSVYRQHAYQMASQMIRANRKKIERKVRKKYNKLFFKCLTNKNHPKFTSKKFADLKINYLKRIKIDYINPSIEVDSRAFDIEKRNSGEFDEFIRLRLPYFQKEKKRVISINLPIKHHYYSNTFKSWNRRNTIKLQKRGNQLFLNLFWEKEDPPKKVTTKKVGIDLGYKKLLATSTGNLYGQELLALYLKISNKKQGSKNFLQLLKHRDQLTNFWTKKFIHGLLVGTTF